MTSYFDQMINALSNRKVTYVIYGTIYRPGDRVYHAKSKVYGTVVDSCCDGIDDYPWAIPIQWDGDLTEYWTDARELKNLANQQK